MENPSRRKEEYTEARIGELLRFLEETGCTSGHGTLNESVPFHPVRTAAHGHVIEHEALRVPAARAWARIDTLVPHAGTILRAIGVQHALRPAAHVGIALVLRQTGARTVIATCVGSAG